MKPIAVTHATDRESMSFLFVRVAADDGSIGYGEACDSYGCSYASVLATMVSDVFAPLVIGQPIDDGATSAEVIGDRLRLFTRRRLGEGWIAAQARSAVELAVWDLIGRQAGTSVSHLIGRHRDRVQVYASMGFLEEGDAKEHIDSVRPLLERGVTGIKTRVGPQWQRDLSILAEMRDLLEDRVELMVDGSEIFTLPTAFEIAGHLAELGVRWFEEPIPQSSRFGIAELARRSPVPIAYGEHLFGPNEAIEAMARGELHVLQPDASTCGGLLAARAMAAAATGFGVRVVPHVCAGPVSLAANLHLAATVPAIRMIEYPPVLAGVWERFAGTSQFGPDAVVDGTLAVPDAPGLGVVLDERAASAASYCPPGARVAGTVGGIPDRFTGDR